MKVAILTPLPKVFEYRRYLAEFLFNSRLYYHIRKSYNIGIALLTIYSIVKNTAISYIAISRIANPQIAYLANPYIIRPATSSPIYRAISPPSPIY